MTRLRFGMERFSYIKVKGVLLKTSPLAFLYKLRVQQIPKMISIGLSVNIWKVIKMIEDVFFSWFKRIKIIILPRFSMLCYLQKLSILC